MRMVQTTSDTSQDNWDWKNDSAFLEQLSRDLRHQAISRLKSGTRAISVSSLVQESLVKLLKSNGLNRPEDRSYLYAFASRAMRYVIVDHIRACKTQKRDRNHVETNLDLLVGAIESNQIDVLAIHEALEVLAIRERRQAQIVEMKFFAGFTVAEIAEHFGLPVTTIESDWKKAKKFLTRLLYHEIE